MRAGIICIPDFIGFTKFVYGHPLPVGQYITQQLLKVLMDGNKRFFNVSEIEGDAILFYKYAKKPNLKGLYKQLNTMFEAFASERSRLSELFAIDIDLSLKIIVHYGIFSIYNLGRYKKLYGRAIVEAHKFLKVKCPTFSSFIFFSDAYLAATKGQAIATDARASPQLVKTKAGIFLPSAPDYFF